MLSFALLSVEGGDGVWKMVQFDSDYRVGNGASTSFFYFCEYTMVFHWMVFFAHGGSRMLLIFVRGRFCVDRLGRRWDGLDSAMSMIQAFSLTRYDFHEQISQTGYGKHRNEQPRQVILTRQTETNYKSTR